MKQEAMQIICTSLQVDNYWYTTNTSTSLHNF